jgi:hypothetical protein
VFKKGDKIILLGCGGIVSPTDSTPQHTSEFFAMTSQENKWCTQCLDLSQDSGESIADSIRNRLAIAVSDGSFKHGYGTAAFVLEGHMQNKQINGRVISPGGEADQLPYRSKIAGILVAMKITSML